MVSTQQTAQPDERPRAACRSAAQEPAVEQEDRAAARPGGRPSAPSRPMSRIRSRTSTTRVEATLKVETRTISPSTRKSATCCSCRAVNSSRLSCRQSVTTKSGSRIAVAASAMRGASCGIGDRELQEVHRGLGAHQPLDQRAVEQHPAPVELGEAGGEGAGDPQALVAEPRPALAEAQGHEPQDVARASAPSRRARSSPSDGAGDAVRGRPRAARRVAVSWPPPGSTPRRITSSPCGRCAADERALAVGDAADLLRRRGCAASASLARRQRARARRPPDRRSPRRCRRTSLPWRSSR